MSAAGFKVLAMIVFFVVMIIIFVAASRKQKKRQETEEHGAQLEVETKSDSYWEQRFNGLKADYENREQYHTTRYEQLKTESETREQFLRDMLNDSRAEYQALKQEIESIRDIKKQLEEKLSSAQKMIADYEIRNMQLVAKMKEYDPNWEYPYSTGASNTDQDNE